MAEQVQPDYTHSLAAQHQPWERRSREWICPGCGTVSETKFIHTYEQCLGVLQNRIRTLEDWMRRHNFAE